MGWASRRGRVASERSPLIASKPKAMPSKGPRKVMNDVNGGTLLIDWPGAKRSRKIDSLPDALGARSLIAPAVVYTAAAPASARTMVRIAKRQLPTWSANSLAALPCRLADHRGQG